MRNIWDGFLSIFAAVATAAICGVPAWFTFQAVQTGLAPVWVYAPLAGLVGVALVMVLAFLRKGFAGISPGRERRR